MLSIFLEYTFLVQKSGLLVICSNEDAFSIKRIKIIRASFSRKAEIFFHDLWRKVFLSFL